jgi:hypothetical protein
VIALAFSGHTEIPERSYGYVAKYVRMHVLFSDVDQIITGAAVGVDTLCHYLAYAWKREAQHTIVVPNGTYNIEIVHFALAMDLDVFFMPEGTDHLDRNTKMIQMADRLVAFPPTADEVNRGQGGGTWSTIRRARKKGIPIFIYPLDQSKPWKENT